MNTISERLKTYGRKRARRLSEAQKNTLLYQLEKYKISIPDFCVDPIIFFGDKSFDRVIIEIGFGHGEHLIENVIKHPNCAFIGCEPFENGVAHAVLEIEKGDLDNILILNDDSRKLLDKIQKNSVAEFHVMFPDPWHKKKHAKRRLMSVDFLAQLHGMLQNDGCIKFASDKLDYVKYVIENLNICKLYNFSSDLEFISNKPQNWSSTRYEQKALSKGNKCYYMEISKWT